VELVEKEVPLVKPIRTAEGFLMLPVKASRKTIRAALRADSRLCNACNSSAVWPSPAKQRSNRRANSLSH
jgi:hypothetical protein